MIFTYHSFRWNRYALGRFERKLFSSFSNTPVNHMPNGLNQAQNRAVCAKLGGVSLCVAGPGSGKTRVLTHRVAHLLEELNQPPSAILTMTFTNKAAQEMKQRLSSLLGEQTSNQLTIGTFHSFAAKILRTYGSKYIPELTGCSIIGSDFTICDKDDCKRIVKKLIKNSGVKEEHVDVNQILGSIWGMKDKNAKGEVIDISRLYAMEKFAFQYLPAYNDALYRSNALDFQDLLLYAWMLLRDKPEVRRRVQRRYHHILVDEYQDTNGPQYELVKLLYCDKYGYQDTFQESVSPESKDGVTSKGDNTNNTKNSNMGQSESNKRTLYVVGDKNQAIYSWRGAVPENMATLLVDYPESSIYPLRENYRSSPQIVAVANAILNINDSDAQILSIPVFSAQDKSRKKPLPVSVVKCMDDREQAKYICKEITRLNKTNSLYSKAILYRTNAQSRQLEVTLMEAGINYRLVGGHKFYERREIRDVMAYLRLLVNPRDLSCASRTINTPSRGIGEKSQHSFFSWMEETIHSKITQTDMSTLVTNKSHLVPSSQQMVPNIFDFLYAIRFIVCGDESLLTAFSGNVELRESLVTNCPLSTRELKVLTPYAKLMTDLLNDVERNNVYELIQVILEKIHISDHLEKISKDPSDAEDRMENINELLSSAKVHRFTHETPREKLSEFVEHTSLFDNSESLLDSSSELTNEEKYVQATGGSINVKSNDVQLMSIHASKGLEYDVVFLTGCEQGCLPTRPRTNMGTMSAEGITKSHDEERRLMYVAVTRAKKILYISWREQLQNYATIKTNKFRNSKSLQTRSEFIIPLEKLDVSVCKFHES